MKTDLDLALQFFSRLREKGFSVDVTDYNNNQEGDLEFDWKAISIELKDHRNNRFCTFDFLQGDFYRVSGMDSTGAWCDEIDFKKYGFRK
jgi:hypothetical protein